MIESTYILTYIQEHPQETKRLLGIDYQQLQDLIAYAHIPYANGGQLIIQEMKSEINLLRSIIL